MAAALDNPDPPRPRDPAEATFDTLVLAAIALAAVALHLGYATGYGYFRDEFYYLACANHLEQYFDTVTEAAVITCLYCMPYEDQLAIYLCRGPKGKPSQVWPREKRFI